MEEAVGGGAMSSEAGLVPLWEIGVGLANCWEFFWLRKIAVPDWEMLECACKYAGWSFWLLQQ
jgi:hypothetical protein